MTIYIVQYKGGNGRWYIVRKHKRYPKTTFVYRNDAEQALKALGAGTYRVHPIQIKGT